MTLFIDIHESLPASTKAPPGIPHHYGVFQIQEQNGTMKNSDKEILKRTENVNKTDSIYRNGNAKDPVDTNHDRQNIEEKSEIDKLAFEMFKTRCQHFQNILKGNKTNDTFYRPPNYENPGVQSRPFYMTPKPIYKPNYVSTTRPNGFYITAQTPGTIKPIVNIQNAPPIKYIRLEPVILQKTILSDGQTVYYWHRSIPTAVELPAQFPTETQPTKNVKNEFEVPPRDVYGYVPQNINVPVPSSGQILSSNSYYYPALGQSSNIVEADKKSVEITTELTTSTTEESYGYGFSNFLPFYSLTKGDSTTSTTSRPTPAPAPSTEKVSTDDLVYAQQLKFIIPVPYDGSQGSSPVQAPWNFDRYAYYPKELQPNTINVRVPYSPTFHMIRAVAIPKLDSTNNDRIDQTDINT